MQLHLKSQDVCEGWMLQCEIDWDLIDRGECSLLSTADRPLCCVCESTHSCRLSTLKATGNVLYRAAKF